MQPLIEHSTTAAGVRTRVVELETAPGGHLGVLTGRAARGTTWVMHDEFLAAPGSGRRGRRAAAAAWTQLPLRRGACLRLVCSRCDGRFRPSY